MTDRERARLIGLLREAARALRPASTYDAWLPERLKREADELARGAYRREPWCECGHTANQHVAVESGDTNHIDCTVCDCTIYPSRDDRRDHDRHSPRTL